jgi:hypothetical protein
MHVGKVVKILDEYTLVIDACEPLVKKGDIVQVYKEGEEIKDPETNESLGNLEMPLSPEMIIISVMPRMSMAKVSEFYRDTVQSRINPFFYTGSRRKLPESIKVGDLVKNVE